MSELKTFQRSIEGVASGVPFLAIPPEGGAKTNSATVVAWHLLDPPRTPAAFAAALPLAGLDAWRVYLGLPMSGSRKPAGGDEELLRLGYEDGVLNIQGPITDQAVSELSPVFSEIRDWLGLGSGPIGLLGGSAGSAVAMLVVAEQDIEVAAAVLVSPMVRLRSVVEAMDRHFGIEYGWSARSRQVATRLDFVERAGEIADKDLAVLLVVGEDDDIEGIRRPAEELRGTLADRYADPARARLELVPGMGHQLADPPGDDPAPQTPSAAQVDRLSVDWFRRYLRSD
jgi:dienelactone hydrolase